MKIKIQTYKTMKPQGDIIFDKINKKLSAKYKGKLVAIEAESGDYFIGDSGLEACQKARKKHPDKIFVVKRIGFEYAYHVLINR